MKIGTVKNENRLLKAINACVENGQRLHEDAEWLGVERSASAIALCILAQEEFAKAFLLHLVYEKTIPWTSKVRESLRDHKHKQLLGIIMEWLSPSYDEFTARMEKGVADFNMPTHVADAIKLYVEKVQPPGYISCPPEVSDPRVKSIAKGDRDKTKQDALYVRLSEDGELVSLPTSFPHEIVEAEFERTKRFGNLVVPLKEGNLVSGLDYHLLLETINFLLMEKRNRPFLILKETKFGEAITLPTGITWPHSVNVCVENISCEQVSCVSGYATIFLDREIVRPAFLFDQFVLAPYTYNIYTFFLSEETYARGITQKDKLDLHVNLEYHGDTLDHNYNVLMWSTYDPSNGIFRERLTDSRKPINGDVSSKEVLETKWIWPKKS